VIVKSSNLSPTISITSPANNTAFLAGATIPISVFATDPNGQIVKVEFFQGGIKLGEDLTSPHSFNWTNVPAGTYQLTTKTTDNLGATGTSAPVIVIVQSSNLIPTISITSPANNATFSAGATVGISVFATDLDGQIVKVEFYQGGIKLGEDLTSPHNFNWTNVPAGTYQLTTKTFDNLGAVGTSAPVTIIVNATTARVGVVPIDGVQINESDLFVNTSVAHKLRVFSPNNDGVNDTWTWQTRDSDQHCPIVIFNRSGRRVFESAGLQTEWDGMINGTPLPEDVYYYETDCNGSKKTGVVRIIR
jgi:gliding motility-associated-like protein